MKGEQSGSTKFFSKKFKALQASFAKKKNKKKENEKDGEGNLESSGKKYSSNGSLVSQANGVNNRQNAKGEHGNIFVLNPDNSPMINVRSINGKKLPSQLVADNNVTDTRVEFVAPPQIVRDIDNCKSSPPSPSHEIVSVLPHTIKTFTEIDTRTCHITTQTARTSHDYLQPPLRGLDDFVNGKNASCFIIATREKGK